MTGWGVNLRLMLITRAALTLSGSSRLEMIDGSSLRSEKYNEETNEIESLKASNALDGPPYFFSKSQADRW